MLAEVKRSLRISHNLLDSDITATINAARAELIRSGVAINKAESDDELVAQAIKTYCLQFYANDTKMAERYQLSFEYQLDNLRKSADYVR